MTLVASSGLSALGTAPAGRTHERNWNYSTDLGTTLLTRDVRVLVTLTGGNGTIAPGASSASAMGAFGNDPPQVLSASVPQAEFEGIVDLDVLLGDSSSDRVDVSVEFDVIGDVPDRGYRIARSTGTPASLPTETLALEAVETTPLGTPYVFRWESDYDGAPPLEDQLPGAEVGVVLRVTVRDSGGLESSLETPPFLVDNNRPPFAVVDEANLVLNADVRNDVRVPFQVFDDESDTVRVVLQWRREGSSGFPDLPATANELAALLDDPGRVDERRAAQIATGAPLGFTGRVGLSAGLPADRVRLPELGSTMAALLARGIPGLTLEILRADLVPRLAPWVSPLDAPVAGLVSADGLSALVLDEASAGWALHEISLSSGALIDTIADGAGAPRGLALDAGRTHLFVATDTEVMRLAFPDGASKGTLAHGLASGARGIVALGSARAVISGDSGLFCVDFREGVTAAVTEVASGLAEPWGLVRDAQTPGSALVAERGKDRILRFDVEHRTLYKVAAEVADDDVPALGSVALPSPRALAQDARTGQLFVMTKPPGSPASLRTLQLHGTIDVDQPADGRADPIVSELSSAIDDPFAGLALGPDATTIVVTPAGRTLALGGGVIGAERIVDAEDAYDPATRSLRLESPLPFSVDGQKWRVQSPQRDLFLGAPEGRRATFLWNTTDVVEGGAVQVRIVPFDNELGLPGEGTSFKSIATGLHVSPRTIPVPSINPRDVKIADLDGDGDSDLAVATEFRVELLFQTEAGVFTPGGSLVPGGRPRSVAVGDLDQDGDVDLVSASAVGTPGVGLLFQSSPGVFEPAGFLPTTVPALFVIATDFDADGDTDLAVVVNGLIFASPDRVGGIQLFFQVTPGVFEAAPELLPPATLLNPTEVDAADLDGDGDMDLILATGGTLQIHHQIAPGVFDPVEVRLDLGDFNGARSVLATDLDGDGDSDIAVTRSLSVLAFFYQVSPGVFERAPDVILTGVLSQSLKAGDLDGDGDTDLATANSDSGDVTAIFQVSPGVFAPSPSPLPTGLEPRGLAFGDVDGNGRIDLATANQTGQDLTLFLQARTGTFGAPERVQASGGLGAFFATDLDADGDLDFALADRVRGEIRIHEQIAPRRFQERPDGIQAPVAFGILTATDMDGDGLLDFVTADPFDGVVFAYRNASQEFEIAVPLPTDDQVEDVEICDLDGDGDLDFVAASGFDGNTLTVYFQETPRSFRRASAPLVAGLGSWRVVSGDFDQDLDLDLACVNAQDATVTVFLQGPPEVFTANAPLPMPGRSFGLAAGDLDQDGDLDLVTADLDDSSLSVFFQAAPGVFQPGPVLPTGLGPRAVIAEDLDGDGDVDLASLDGRADGLSVFEQIAPGLFRRSQQLAVGTDPIALFSTDVDGDGEVDLAALSGKGSDVIVHYNNHE